MKDVMKQTEAQCVFTIRAALIFLQSRQTWSSYGHSLCETCVSSKRVATRHSIGVVNHLLDVGLDDSDVLSQLPEEHHTLQKRRQLVDAILHLLSQPAVIAADTYAQLMRRCVHTSFSRLPVVTDHARAWLHDNQQIMRHIAADTQVYWQLKFRLGYAL